MNRMLKNALVLFALILAVTVGLPLAAVLAFAARSALLPCIFVVAVAMIVSPKVRHALDA